LTERRERGLRIAEASDEPEMMGDEKDIKPKIIDIKYKS
jgi:hypothetical protein